jgi:hypothetical protein
MTESPDKLNYNVDSIDDRFKKLEKNLESNLTDKIEARIANKIGLTTTSISYDIRSDMNLKMQDIKNAMQNSLSEELRNMRNNLPSEIDKSLKATLYNNNKFDELFKSYSATLNTQLNDGCTKIIQQVIKDPAHNQLVTGHLNNVSTTCQSAIAGNQESLNKQLNDHQLRFNKQSHTFQSQINTELDNMNKRYQTDFRQLKDEVQNVNLLHQRIRSVESRNNYLSAGLVILGISNFGLFALKYLRR